MRSPEPCQILGRDGVALHAGVWRVPNPRGRVVVVHGFSEHSGRYDLLAEALNARGYSVLAYDQRGHGDSPGARGVIGSFSDYVDDLSAVLGDLDATLPGLEEPFLLGHSMGGLVAIRFLQTVDHSLRGAVLSAPWLDTALEVPAWKRFAAAVLLRVAPNLPLAGDIRPERLTRDPVRAAAYADDPKVHRLMSSRLWDEVRRAQRTALASGLKPELPVLVLLPGADPVTDVVEAERWAQTVAGPAVETVLLAGRRHEPFNDLGRDEVFEMLCDWLDGVPVRNAREVRGYLE
jgi:lysophospholipase